MQDEANCNHDKNVYCSTLNNWDSCVIPKNTTIGIQATSTDGRISHCIGFIDYKGQNFAGSYGGSCDQNDGYKFTGSNLRSPRFDGDQEASPIILFNRVGTYFGSYYSVTSILHDSWDWLN